MTFRFFLFECFVLSFCLALLGQTDAKPDGLSTSGSSTKVTVQQIELKTASESATAHVFTPTGSGELAAVVLSHSEVVSPEGTVSLLPLAKTIAAAGAAVIVLDRPLYWEEPSKETVNRQGGEILKAAERWLLSHDPVDGNRYAFVGCAYDSGVEPFRLQRLPYDHKRIHNPTQVHIGEHANGDNTNALFRPDGQLGIAQYLQRRLSLQKISNLDN